MIVLGIETATTLVGVGLVGHDGPLAQFEVVRGRRHAEILAPAIEFVCRQADITMDELGCIAVDVGPGLFTGMRVGIASAKALSYALRIPIVGLPSLDVLAFSARHSGRLVVPVIDARKAEVFYAMYRQVPGGVQQVLPPTVGSIDELVADLLARSEDTLLIGDGAHRYREQIEEGFRCEIDSPLHPPVATLAALAQSRALREEWSRSDEIEALYLRSPDAQINWATREAR